MSLVAWIVLGFLSGFLASKFLNKAGEGRLLDIGLGIVGAVIGGGLANTLAMPGVTAIDVYSLLGAIVGAVVLLVGYDAVFRGAR